MDKRYLHLIVEELGLAVDVSENVGRLTCNLSVKEFFDLIGFAGNSAEFVAQAEEKILALEAQVKNCY